VEGMCFEHTGRRASFRRVVRPEPHPASEPQVPVQDRVFPDAGRVAAAGV